jgi:hypothetical protein
MRHPAVLSVLFVLVGCAGKGEPIEPPVGDGKGDVVDRVALLGPLPLGGEVRGAMTEDLEFHGYTLDVRPGARVDLEITQKGTQRSLDATLYVYGPERPAGGYGTEAIDMDDDGGWGRHPRLRDLALADGGRYLVVVGSHDGRGRGGYRLTATCAAGECAPIVSTGACHVAIADDIRACVADLMADVETAPASEVEAVALCADAEPTADAFDAACAAAAPPALCASFVDFAQHHLPVCRAELEDEVLDRTCALGQVYRDLWRLPGLHVLSHRRVTSAAGLSALTRAQIVRAVQASSHTDVTTAEEALGRVDEGEINLVEVWDATGRRGFTALEYGAGDNSYGRIFAAGTAAEVVDINDGDLHRCTAMHGDELRRCAADLDCADGLSCVGADEAIGRGSCVDLAADDHPAETADCSAAAPCPAGSGLLCAGLSRGDQGLCLPAWMRRRFETRPDLSIPDGGSAGAAAQVAVFGLATVDVDVWLAAVVVHPRPSDLRVFVANPDGSEVLAFDGAAAGASGPELELDLPVRGFSGDESVNGVWSVRVVDRVSGQRGTVDHVALTIGSRWD